MSRKQTILEYLESLQLEYLLYKMRLKIYPINEFDKNNRILEFKETKIKDICDKNKLKNIFNDNNILKEIEEKFYNDFGNPKKMTKRDSYYYYSLGMDFVYEGRGVKLKSYDLAKNSCVVQTYKKELIETKLNNIRRVF